MSTSATARPSRSTTTSPVTDELNALYRIDTTFTQLGNALVDLDLDDAALDSARKVVENALERLRTLVTTQELAELDFLLNGFSADAPLTAAQVKILIPTVTGWLDGVLYTATKPIYRRKNVEEIPVTLEDEEEEGTPFSSGHYL